MFGEKGEPPFAVIRNKRVDTDERIGDITAG